MASIEITMRHSDVRIEALKEFENTGFTNEYMPADVRVVTNDNIADYLREKEEEDA